MSMLRYFFEIGSDSSLFDGLIISREKELCEKYQGKFPVISITLKGVWYDLDSDLDNLWSLLFAIGYLTQDGKDEEERTETACQEAVRQIREKNYEEMLADDGMTDIRRYGIACYKKRCKVVLDSWQK